MAICMKYLFVCVENAARSQMAEAFAREMGIEAASAGTLPASSINPDVIKVMQEIGIDMSGYKPKLLTMEMIERADVVVTMGCSIEGVCPAPMLRKMKKKLIEWNIEDPKGKPIEEVRRIRDEIKEKIISLVKSK
jgi:Protein-tyrosine-phosphatase